MDGSVEIGGLCPMPGRGASSRQAAGLPPALAFQSTFSRRCLTPKKVASSVANLVTARVFRQVSTG